MSFRILAAALALASLLLCQPSGSPATDPVRRLYIGTYTSHGSEGIYSATFDERSGVLANVSLAAATVDPSFLAFHPRLPFLYAVNEGTNEVSSFAASPGSANLKLVDRVSSGGGGPCYLTLDRSGSMLLVANYGGGSFGSFKVLPDGRIGTRSDFVQFTGSGPNPKRQQSPHAHFAYVTPDDRFALITDLGTDRIMVYRIDPATASVKPADQPFGLTESGGGPRHLVFSPDQRTVYVLNEVQSSITRFAFDGNTGAMRKLDTVSALPPGFHGNNTSAEIAIGPQGRWLVVSNRGDDSLVVFGVGASGTLRRIQRVPSGGRTPRNFVLDPSGHWLLAANQDSDNVRSFKIDPKTGNLTATPNVIAVKSPVCLLFAR